MNKMMTISMAALISIAFTACGSNSKKTEVDLEEAEAKAITGSWEDFSDAEKLAYALATQNSATPSSANYTQESTVAVKSSRAYSYMGSESCENSGVITYRFDDQAYAMQADFQNCLMDGMLQDGLIEVTFGNYDTDSGSVQFPEGFSVSGEEAFTIYPGSHISYSTEGEYEVSVLNIEAISNGLAYGAVDLIYKGKYLDNGYYVEFPVSGQEKIGDSAYFTVDPNYDASQTPITYNRDYDLISGTARYLDEAEHSVELTVYNTNVITVKVDENGDRSFSDDEISAITLD